MSGKVAQYWCLTSLIMQGLVASHGGDFVPYAALAFSDADVVLEDEAIPYPWVKLNLILALGKGD